MKKNYRKCLMNVSCLIHFFIVGMALSCLPAFSGTWDTEGAMSGIESVHIYTPATSPVVDNKRALMISLHGCSMSNTDMKNNAGWETIADEVGMIVALPDVPGGGVYTDCWDYYGENHTRSNKYNNELIALANELMSRTNLNVDTDQVYISGFSAGATQATVVACLAPDIFAGVGSHSGPGIGTSSKQFSRLPRSYSVLEMADLCEGLAGSYANYFNTQVYSTIHGSSDNNVTPEYNTTGAEIMSLVYGASNESASQSVPTDGAEVLYSDGNGPRVSRITVNGLQHDWSSSGGNSGYFANNKVDYPEYLTRWLFVNNRRVSGGGGGGDEDGDGDGVIFSLDCDDTDSTIFPGATEICGDGIDQDCSGADEQCGGGWTCVEYTSTNTEHYNSNPSRASFQRSGKYIYYYAIGSGESLPEPGKSSMATLAETSQGYFVVGSCL